MARHDRANTDTNAHTHAHAHGGGGDLEEHLADRFL